MLQLTINAEAKTRAEIINILQDILSKIEIGVDGEYDFEVGWSLDSSGESGEAGQLAKV